VTPAESRKGSRRGFGALLVGHYRGDQLVYAGKVGTGFDDRLLDALSRRLRSIERDRPAFSAGQLRHPRFLGLREVKDPREVVRERPA
jgi:bifunctional non-homologous end joining protein LigD